MTPPYVRRVAPEELTKWQRHLGCPLTSIGNRRCRKPITHLAVSAYVMPKWGGREAYRRQPVCVAHAERFATRHRLKLDEAREARLA